MQRLPVTNLLQAENIYCINADTCLFPRKDEAMPIFIIKQKEKRKKYESDA